MNPASERTVAVVPKRAIDKTVPLHPGEALERPGNNAHAEMSADTGLVRARVPDMAMRLVDNLQFLRCKAIA